MVKCNVCGKEHSPLLPRQFHSFPTDAERREKWFNSIGYVVNAYKNARICSDHFIENDYYYTGTPIRGIRLKKIAIPSVFTQKSCRKLIEKDSRSNSQNDNQDKSLMDIEHETTMNIQHQSQQSTINIHDNLILTKPIVESCDTDRRRKRHKINDMEKIFLKTGKYNIECIKKTEFVTDKAWIKFVKYVNYNRYLHKLFVTQKSRAQKKMVTLQSVTQTLKTLKSKNLIKRNILNDLSIKKMCLFL